jgi:hypothetical protein
MDPGFRRDCGLNAGGLIVRTLLSNSAVSGREARTIRHENGNFADGRSWEIARFNGASEEFS